MYEKEKVQAEKAIGADQCGTLQGVAGQVGRPYTLREEAEKRADHHYGEAQKAQSAASFLAKNPAFEDFIRLVRSGAIQF